MPIRTLRFDNNNIQSYSVKRMAHIFSYCKLLSDFSLSNNPIGDIGLFYYLQSCLNIRRKAYITLPMPINPNDHRNANDETMDVDKLEQVEDIGTDEESEPKVIINQMSTFSNNSNAMQNSKSNSFQLARRISIQQKKGRKSFFPVLFNSMYVID